MAGVVIVAKFYHKFYLQTRPVPYSQVVFIQAHKEGKPPVPVVFALLSKKVSLFNSYNIFGTRAGLYGRYRFMLISCKLYDFTVSQLVVGGGA